jgi:hypothetical protein
MKATHDFVAALLRDVPELEDTYRHHVLAYDEVLPHVLMGDVTRFALKLAELSASSVADAAKLERLLAVLEHHMALGASDVRELIAVSFLENLEDTEPGYSCLASRLGTALSSEMTRLHGGDP